MHAKCLKTQIHKYDIKTQEDGTKMYKMMQNLNKSSYLDVFTESSSTLACSLRPNRKR